MTEDGEQKAEGRNMAIRLESLEAIMLVASQHPSFIAFKP